MNSDRALSAPLRLCAVDVGSNSIKMRIVEGLPEETSWRTLAEARYPVRLGNSFQPELAIPIRGAVAATVQVFGAIARTVQQYQVHRTRVVATSALREMRNASELCDAVRLATGLQIEVISGLEEARLLAAGTRPDCRPGVANLIMDVGGGSTELIVIAADGIVSYLVSMPLGAVRLQQTVAYGNPPSDEDYQKLSSHIGETLDEYQLPELTPGSHALGVAGTVSALVQAHRFRGGTGIPLQITDVAGMTQDMVGRTLEEVVARWGIDEHRAEVILPGALTVQLVMQRFGISSLVYSVRTLRDGVLSEMMKQVV